MLSKTLGEGYIFCQVSFPQFPSTHDWLRHVKSAYRNLQEARYRRWQLAMLQVQYAGTWLLLCKQRLTVSSHYCTLGIATLGTNETVVSQVDAVCKFRCCMVESDILSNNMLSHFPLASTLLPRGFRIGDKVDVRKRDMSFSRLSDANRTLGET